MASEFKEWSPATAGQPVRLVDDPGRQGTTTGRIRTAGSRTLVEIDWGLNERSYQRYETLELVPSTTESPADHIRAGRYSTPTDLRRALVTEKIRGDLTNVFYSMESSQTDFYAYQFRPVLRFIESTTGRLLIADEVGLGKTIEAAYIWRELQAREGARRLLVVCPAMLREKWQQDLQTKFGVSASLVSADDLLGKLRQYLTGEGGDQFACIASIEGLRPPADYESSESQSARIALAKLLDQNRRTDDRSLFDLTIVDEAHYLRNPETQSHRLGRLLEDASASLLLLTATPVQMGSENLFHLLRLLGPDQFDSLRTFDEMLEANRPLLAALRAVQATPPDAVALAQALTRAMRSPYLANDPVLARVLEHANSDYLADPARSADLARKIDSRSLLGQFMTRTRKRDVTENRVLRRAHTLEVRLTDLELAVYRHVTRALQSRARGASMGILLSLITRQRQMASCMPAAIARWNRPDSSMEDLWEDLGDLDLDDSQPGFWDDASPSLDDVLDGSLLDRFSGNPSRLAAALEADDSKYTAFLGFVKQQISEHPGEKFVVFAFFRATLEYLQRRLKADGIRCCAIAGGMGAEKQDVLRAFEADDGPSILLSSEVGSEGIDLQFCRTVVNYDLPWNPMRVEQRIGRIDRLGQKALAISIVNLTTPDTIEERVLRRLYERIRIFEESIGDLETILGELAPQLAIDLFRPDLSDTEKEAMAAQNAQAIENRRQDEHSLEDQAINLIGFFDYILSTIRESHDQHRWLSGDELLSLVEDFFAQRYSGTEITRPSTAATQRSIRLSPQARNDFSSHLNRHQGMTATRLHVAPGAVECAFDTRTPGTSRSGREWITASHPLVQWISRTLQGESPASHRTVAAHVPVAEAAVPAGTYAFLVLRWSFSGLKKECRLAYAAIDTLNKSPLDALAAERLVGLASRHGSPLVNTTRVLANPAPILSALDDCEILLTGISTARFDDFAAEDQARRMQQETSARRLADFRTAELEQRIIRLRANGNERMVPATEGLLRGEKRRLEEKLHKLASQPGVREEYTDVAQGVIVVS